MYHGINGNGIRLWVHIWEATIITVIKSILNRLLFTVERDAATAKLAFLGFSDREIHALATALGRKSSYPCTRMINTSLL